MLCMQSSVVAAVAQPLHLGWLLHTTLLVLRQICNLHLLAVWRCCCDPLDVTACLPRDLSDVDRNIGWMLRQGFLKRCTLVKCFAHCQTL